MELSKTLQIPVKNRENIIRFIIGGILDIIPVLNLLSSGYAFLLMRDRILKNTSEDMPEWENWGTLFKYGILTFLISLGYAIIPIAIMGLGAAAIYPHIAILEYIGTTLFIIGGICFLAAIFLLPMGVVLFAIDDEFSSAFSFFHVIDMAIKHIGLYFKAFIIIFIMWIVLGFLSLIPVVGWIIGVFVGFYLLLESALLLGDVGQAIAGRGEETPPKAESTEGVAIETPAESGPVKSETTQKPSTAGEEIGKGEKDS